MHIRLDGCGCGCNLKTLEGRLDPVYRYLYESPGARIGITRDAVVFILDDRPGGEVSLWWRRTSSGDRGKYMWSLEIDIDTCDLWDRYEAHEPYGPSGFQVVEYEDPIELVEYVGRVGIISDEAAPLSVLGKHNTGRTN
jgi:hypothetical protein